MDIFQDIYLINCTMYIIIDVNIYKVNLTIDSKKDKIRGRIVFYTYLDLIINKRSFKHL